MRVDCNVVHRVFRAVRDPLKNRFTLDYVSLSQVSTYKHTSSPHILFYFIITRDVRSLTSKLIILTDDDDIQWRTSVIKSVTDERPTTRALYKVFFQSSHLLCLNPQVHSFTLESGTSRNNDLPNFCFALLSYARRSSMTTIFKIHVQIYSDSFHIVLTSKICKSHDPSFSALRRQRSWLT